MAFTFVVEDGTGLATATSYVSVADADDIIAVNIHIDQTWLDLGTDSKEKLLAWATRIHDAQTRWKGTKTVATSQLRWPRTGVCDRDETLIGINEIPYQLEVATAEYARYLIAGDRTLERDQDGLIRLKADVVELEFKDGYQLPQIPAQMTYLLDGLGYISSGGQHPRFVRLSR